ncbi:2-amino-4-hydroxy-6-hydroxymethyldihydropteridine diphosphokinase [Turicibacter sanguinis]|jgi:2-amino-4-hydroxy-6-hydroxymethyldihydropteridine diphosphokinase|uniref:2-amino-4-hydroxy-6- hydroxymethyldihydropteridine diphosphokinase n=1 Tax=Turicibacter sanguinis TaxID=154288 RepID=UPI0012BBA377|nr:2-amino-4-hydroxy-6-hydroxymethyldihydropteridine diphosphokinase [Turicibacter sanguinis]MDB8438802.1 2-amino-4-hydroxy-6-hydroxymethyldihydropteridine diphosphokinase [Turicibacter sanguinis]MDB8555682.1 2-amino-4-hydroxy-6-hydroxymethyldihydropteridine diphosphokinase [Turicibacter sanguinis]MDB8559191.1 2-amino-4-hydroxy-6-hydroxymethyldihydropteridine diphosphokinase [Turicibacter sanguinis]MDB8561987.1 2-amino-4-hydroxy-6-hydroxymethyldihydropteridine diphosphokinase [Turicibacter sang
MKLAYLSLGSNIGDKKKYLYDAIKLLDGYKGIRIVKLSSLYETSPWGYTEQDLFMNLVVLIETSLSPVELLDCCQFIEQELGRVRLIKWGPRVIDVDILLFEDETINTERLTIPHPFMTERDFVMIPLCEIAKDLKIDGITVETIIQKFDQKALKKVIA